MTSRAIFPRTSAAAPRSGIRARLLTATIAAVALALTAGAARATTITVTTTADDFTNNGNCSLREAFEAANFNIVRDQCPAGLAGGTDEIVLADGATYSLTIPFSGPNSGPLVVVNDGAFTDILIRVVNDGEATISQDATPDTRVLVVQADAHLKLQDTVIAGGFDATGDGGGGGVFVASGGEVDLERCTVRDNVAQDNGGGIRVFSGTVVAIDTIFQNNSGAAGGAVSTTGTAPIALIQRCRFQDNRALNKFGGGGALEITGQTSVVDSVFLNNLSAGVGGAVSFFNDVAGQSSIVGSCFVGNQAKFDAKGVHVFAGSVPLAAGSNWWGASNGPSGAGPGVGDGVNADVNFSFKLTAPPAACLPLTLVPNGGFESDVDGDLVPDRWSLGNLVSSSDGLRCNADGCFLRMTGNGANKVAQQVIPVHGSAGDVIRFRAKANAQSVPSGAGNFRAVLSIVFTDSTTKEVTLNFTTGTHAFEKLSQNVAASKDYKRILVRLEYSKPSGSARFDDVAAVLTD